MSALLGELERRRGRRAAARRAFERALALVPDHPGAEAGLARLEAERGPARRPRPGRGAAAPRAAAARAARAAAAPRGPSTRPSHGCSDSSSGSPSPST